MALRPGWLALAPEDWLVDAKAKPVSPKAGTSWGDRHTDKGTYGRRPLDVRTDVGNLFPFYMTLSPIGAATQKRTGRRDKPTDRYSRVHLEFPNWGRLYKSYFSI